MNINKEFKCTIDNCIHSYITKRGLENHLLKIHNISSHPVLQETEGTSSGNSSGASSLSSSPINNDGFEKEHLDMALELSIKDYYKEFIPNHDQMCEILDKKLCILCANKVADIAFIDCGHVIACYDCALRIKNSAKQERRCPNCRKNIKNFIKIYI